MTKEQQIQEALKLLAPPAAERKECLHEIQVALGRVDNFTAFARSSRAIRSKKGGLLLYHRALRRLLRAFDSLDPAIKPWFCLAPSSTTRIKIEAEIANTKELLEQSPAPRRHGSRNKAAVAVAYDLLAWRGHNATVTRGGTWEELAQILAGDLTVDLFELLRKFKKNPSTIVEKVRVDSGHILYRSARPQPASNRLGKGLTSNVVRAPKMLSQVQLSGASWFKPRIRNRLSNNNLNWIKVESGYSRPETRPIVFA